MSHIERKLGWVAAGGAALALSLLGAGDAEACGCFAPPDPSVPIVQAGERIVFAQQDGEVLAHIQIQYAGKPGDFGWLLPLPAIPHKTNGEPGIDVGVDELFSQLLDTTQPRYRLSRVFEPCGDDLQRSPRAGGFSEGSSGADLGAPPGEPGRSPLVVQDSIGPYEYAILKADDKTEMFGWLARNRYFVPVGTEEASGPYIRKGAFFVALRLRAGQTAGDLQPVVVRYKSDLPMIPIVLTSVGANPNMGIQVWMLGRGRAIPRNYYHTVINDSQINWFTAGQNYNDVIIRAVGEAKGKHSFVTEYAGTTRIMRNLLDRPNRFSGVSGLAAIADPALYLKRLQDSGVPLGSQLFGILAGAIPMPRSVADRGVQPAQYYLQFSSFLREAMADPMVKAKLDAFDPAALTREINDRIVQPTLEAGALFTAYPYMTRLYTTLSPEDMNKDPVFSYNPDLPDYSNVHQATLTYHCSHSLFGGGRYSSATLITEGGWRSSYSIEEVNRSAFAYQGLPFSLRIETLRETGAPEVVVDNTALIRDALGGGSGCRVTGTGGGDLGLLGLLGASFGLAMVRRRRGR